jgi:SpoVK/Ycf46/Vps4 family AAA+-type ATPase
MLRPKGPPKTGGSKRESLSRPALARQHQAMTVEKGKGEAGLMPVGWTSSPTFSSSFPASEISTEHGWHDLVLSEDVLTQVAELRNWIEHNDVLLDDRGTPNRIKPGYRALFHGSPGTGKTLAVTLIGKYTGRKVFRVDLSTIISKYIGETVKNLATLFDRARGRNWILFFDEAGALFGKRTNVKDSHDRYTNLEASYLLQEVEEFDGVVILASNLKANMDEAFLRRFNAIIEFPFPKEEEREAIWKLSFPTNAAFEDSRDFPKLLARFELSGGNIMNVVVEACSKCHSRGGELLIRLDDVLEAIRREMEKEGRVFKNILA